MLFPSQRCNHFDSHLLQIPVATHQLESRSERKSWRSNDVLPEETQEIIRCLLKEALEDMDFLNWAIATAPPSTQRTRFEKDRRIYTARIHSFRSAISSLKMILSEILGKIFMYCCYRRPPSPWDCFPGNSDVELPPGKSGYPWTLGHVCSHWRDSLWNTPSIWNRIVIQKAYNSAPMKHPIGNARNTVILETLN